MTKNYAELAAEQAEAVLDVFSDDFPEVLMSRHAWRSLQRHISNGMFDLLTEVEDDRR